MKKNKLILIRIIICLLLFIPAFIINLSLNLSPLLEYLLFVTIYLIIGYDVLFKAIKNIFRGQVFDENFLMCIATLGALGIGQCAEAVAVMLFYQIGELFQNYAVNKSRKSITQLMEICPTTATILKDGKEQIIEPENIKINDVIIVKPGEKIPLDGIIINGKSSLNVSALTGESLPIYCKTGDRVLSGSINQTEVLKIRCEKLYSDSTVSKILDLVENSATKKSKAENFISKFAKYYTPIVVGLALLLFLIPSLITQNWIDWLHRALMFLVVSCPCALVISVPLSFFGGIGGASKSGVLIKGGNYLEMLDKANIFVFDKTGTLTEGTFTVQKITPQEKRQEILELASIAENGSLHPIAQSILKEVSGNIPQGYNIKEIAGKGMVATKNDVTILAGNEKLMQQYKISFKKENSVGTIVYVAKNGAFIGSICIADKIKQETKQIIQNLKDNNIKTVMLTGDNEETAKQVANTAKIDQYYSNLLPADKVEKLEELFKNKNSGDVISFVGDGINDAPVLIRSDVGIAMGAIGSDSAIEAADIVLMNDNLNSLLLAKKIAHKTMRIVKQNIIFSIGIKIAVLLLSALGFANLWLAIFADVGVTVLAILNAMRMLKKQK